MSSYKKYSSPWLKSPSYDSSSSKSDTSTSKFGSSSYTKNTQRSPSDSKDSSHVKYKYGSNNTSSTNTTSSNPDSTYHRDKPASRDAVISGKQYEKSDLASRFKSAIEKKDTLHVPSVSYRPLNRTETRSRDPSIERDTSSNNTYGYKSLYSPGASRSLRSPISRERSKDDLTYTYRTSSTNSSREDVSNIANKYITSRFLPKNTIEKSHTAYIRPASSRIASNQRETSRKNRELLNLLHVQQYNDKSSSSEKQSIYNDSISAKNDNKLNIEERRDNMVHVNVISRGTSPTFPNTTQLFNSRRVDMTRLVEKQILRPINPRISVVDKQTQSEQLEDSDRTNQSKLSYSDYSKLSSKAQRKKGDTPSSDGSKTPSRSSSTKSMISVKSEKTKDSKSSDENKSTKSNTNDNKKQLPPCTPYSKPQVNLPNKDFRKSVLNMNSDVKSTKTKIGKRTDSVSSIDSESNTETNVTYNIKLPKKGSPGSKLPKPFSTSDAKNKNRSGGTTSEGSSHSGNEDDGSERKGNSQVSNCSSSSDNEKVSKPPINPKIRIENGVDSKSFLMRALAPVTSFFKQKNHDSSDKSELQGEDTTLWDIKTDVAYSSKYCDDKTIGSGIDEEEDFSVFENEREFSFRNGNQCKSTMNLNDKAYQSTTETEEVRHKITHIRSGEKPWWLESNSDKEDTADRERKYNNTKGTERIINEDIGTPLMYADGSSNKSLDTTENIMTSEYSQKYKIRHIDSGERAWWLDSQENIPEGITKWELKVTDSTAGNRISNGSISDELIIPLGDRASPEGLENPNETNSGRATPYDNVPRRLEKNQRPQDLFISHHTNIDDILGGGNYSLSPLISRIFSYQGNESEQSFNEIQASPGKSTYPSTHKNERNNKVRLLNNKLIPMTLIAWFTIL